VEENITMLDLLKSVSLRAVSGLVALLCLGMLIGALVMQHGLNLEPCPMCIVQRYAVILVGVFAALAWALAKSRAAQAVMTVLAGLFAGFGAFVAARQSWLQWYPPEIQTCGRDFYGMIETFPLKRAMPMIFRGSGDCAKVDWSFLGLSIANWSFIAFVAMLLALVWALLRRRTA
jgi:protein dithiol:quinone oxidoreductase